MSKDIVVVSNNQNKIKEFKEILKGFNVLSLADLNIELDVVEDGKTFEQNAILKVLALSDKYPYVIADDSGLEINALNKQPGVYSARFLGKDKPYAKKNLEVIEMLENKLDRSANFTSVIAFSDHQKIKTFTGIIHGEISHLPKGSNGFGYDPIFFIKEYGQTFGQMKDELKNKISHRAIALNKLKEYLKDEKIID